MMGNGQRSRARIARPLGLALGLCACATVPPVAGPPRIAVLSAFPAELVPLLERATVEETVEVGDRVFRLGRLGGVPVVLGLTGIGMVNAAQTTRLVLDRFEPVGVVVSGVAGTPRRIGDVDVPVAWALKQGGESWPADPGWLELAQELGAPGALPLERSAIVPTGDGGERVRLAHVPELAVGGVGRSGDDFGDKAFPCDPEGDDVSGCDVPPAGVDARPPYDPRAMQPIASEWEGVVDMETAAIAREAANRGLPYIAFRAGSDGSGDPLGLPGFPAQFYAYYRLAARNAAAAATTFLERLAESRGRS
jgi:nucleoside phosphorylase